MKQLHRALAVPLKASVALAGGLLLASCGGGDPYSGLWVGELDGNRQLTAVVLGDGDYYMWYSRPGAPGSVGGVLQGAGDFRAGTVSSPDARDYNWEGAGTKAARLSGKLGARQSVSGSVDGRTPFKVSYARDLDDDARLATLVGAFPGEVTFALGTRPATFTVTAKGQVSTSINGCPITGQVSPRGDTNAFDLTIVFGGPPCVFPYAQFSGVAIYREDLKRLDAAVVHASRTQAIAFTGSR